MFKKKKMLNEDQQIKSVGESEQSQRKTKRKIFKSKFFLFGITALILLVLIGTFGEESQGEPPDIAETPTNNQNVDKENPPESNAIELANYIGSDISEYEADSGNQLEKITDMWYSLGDSIEFMLNDTGLYGFSISDPIDSHTLCGLKVGDSMQDKKILDIIAKNFKPIEDDYVIESDDGTMGMLLESTKWDVLLSVVVDANDQILALQTTL